MTLSADISPGENADNPTDLLAYPLLRVIPTLAQQEKESKMGLHSPGMVLHQVQVRSLGQSQFLLRPRDSVDSS